MPVEARLSPEAKSLLLACYSGEYILANDGNQSRYRELAQAGLMTPLHTPLGRDSAYRMTQEGVNADHSYAPSPAKASSLRRSRAISYLRRLSSASTWLPDSASASSCALMACIRGLSLHLLPDICWFPRRNRSSSAQC